MPDLPELWQWAEFYCPWCYVSAVRLHAIAPEFAGKIRLRERAFPLEVNGGGPPQREELEQEIWLAALQEPRATFNAFKSDWPNTTLPAFEGAWSAAQQGEQIGREFDLAIRRAFFAEGLNIGKPEVILELARQTNLDLDRFQNFIHNGKAKQAILEEGRLGKEEYKVRGTPTLMNSMGKRYRHPLAYPRMEDGRTVGVSQLECFGTGCDDLTRAFFEDTLAESKEN